jgi:hypothetical protein
LYTTNNITIDLINSNLKYLVLASEGLVVYYNERTSIVFDTVSMRIINEEFTADFMLKLK